MTRLLFVHDHRFYRDSSDAVLTSGSLPAEVWDRYLEHFGSICVIGRDGGLAAANANYAVSSRPGVTFDLIANVSYVQLITGSRAVRQRIHRDVATADAVIVRLPSELGFLAAAECRRSGKPYSVEMVGCSWDAMRNQGSWSAWFYTPLFFQRTRRALRRAPSTLYVTSKWLQGRYPTHGKSFSASDVEIARLAPDAAQSRRDRLERIRGGEHPVLGTVASLRIKSKGVQTALEALELLRNEGLELHYRVLGGGDPAPWLALARKHGVADLVLFDGVRPAGAGVWQWLDAVDIHLQPSFQEGLPRATVEAMSRGAACIGSTCGGIPELIPGERLHEPGDAAGLARLIRALATDPKALQAASAADLETAAGFQPHRLGEIRAQFLDELRSRTERAP
jgi:glycosyltransferase involved in cell wall biosynthesis